jgi:hypothetical protein
MLLRTRTSESQKMPRQKYVPIGSMAAPPFESVPDQTALIIFLYCQQLMVLSSQYRSASDTKICLQFAN